MAKELLDLHSASMDRVSIYQRYLLQPNQANLAAAAATAQANASMPDEEEEEEPVHALDLRICKVDATISRLNAPDLLAEAAAAAAAAASSSGHPISEPATATTNTSFSSNTYGGGDDNRLHQPPSLSRIFENPPSNSRECLSPMVSAFPGQIPPDRRMAQPDMRHLNQAKGVVGVRPMSELTEQSNACKIVEAATSGWRYSPYDKSFSNKSERNSPSPGHGAFKDEFSPRTHNSLVMRNRVMGVGGAKSTFLHYVLKNKEKMVEVKKEPPSADTCHEVDRRMELVDQTFQAYGNRYPLLDYSPPPSPPPVTAIPPGMMSLGGSASANPDLIMRQREFLMRLQQGHFGQSSSQTQQQQMYNSMAVTDMVRPNQYRQYAVNLPSRSPPPLEPLSPDNRHYHRRSGEFDALLHHNINSSAASSSNGETNGKGKRGRPRKHAIKIPLPPLYVFIRNMLHNRHYNPRVITWISEAQGIFKVNNTSDFAKTWGLMKSNRNEEMTYEKMSRAMRYHYGNEKQGRKGHLAMVKEKRLVYRFGELAINWKTEEVLPIRPCPTHELCGGSMCLWRKE